MATMPQSSIVMDVTGVCLLHTQSVSCSKKCINCRLMVRILSYIHAHLKITLSVPETCDTFICLRCGRGGGQQFEHFYISYSDKKRKWGKQ